MIGGWSAEAAIRWLTQLGQHCVAYLPLNVGVWRYSPKSGVVCDNEELTVQALQLLVYATVKKISVGNVNVRWARNSFGDRVSM